jgi:hypothetical protein
MNIRATEESDGESDRETPRKAAGEVKTSRILLPSTPPISAKERKENLVKRLGYNPSAPVAPEFILNRVAGYLENEKICIKQRFRFLTAACKYWALKRASRRGAPLLKRLHLEVFI